MKILFKINKDYTTKLCWFLWLLYFIYSIVLTIYDISTVKQINWNQAKNISKTYGGYKATIVTHAFKKGKITIQRKYSYFTQGLNVFLWDINKNANIVDISFFVKKKDYMNIINNSPSYHNYLFSKQKKAVSVPFFGLRKLGEKSNKILLFIDLWKYNFIYYSILGAFFVPYFIFYISAKFKIQIIEYEFSKKEDIIWKKVMLFMITIFIFSIII